MTQEKKEKLTTNVITAIIAAIIIFCMASCTPKYGCPATRGTVGYHPFQK